MQRSRSRREVVETSSRVTARSSQDRRRVSWFEVSDGRLRFRGRVTKQPIDEWLASAGGIRTVDAAARSVGFALFGRARAARRRVRRQLWQAVDSSAVRDLIAAECDRYLSAWSDLAYAPSLPRRTVSLNRLVVVPRAMIPGRAGPGAQARFAACLAATGEGFRTFLCHWVLCRMDDAIRSADPTSRHPVRAGDCWACIGLEDRLIWVDPNWSGQEWRGHVVLFEMPSPRLSRRQRLELDAAIEQLTRPLPNLTRLQRDAIVRVAADEMEGLTHARTAAR
jgi:hypothetical protein